MQHYQSEEDHFLWAYLRLPLISVFADGFLIGVLNWLAFGNLIDYLIDVTTLLSVYYNLIALCSIIWPWTYFKNKDKSSYECSYNAQ